ncbi:MAG: glycosyltransferase family 39 protein, partial [Bacteroidia bacterium]|nr:glycosyltransferase family 39 protein [Bacteroidia bacterium]
METHPDPKKRKLINLTIFIVLGFSFFLRLYNLEDYPLAINQDELSNIYDGYSIAETGADRWGSRYPTILRAFGDADYRPPMYAWISALSVKLFGFSVISGRLPAAIIGCLSLILLCSLCKKAGGSLFALITIFLAGLSPWHILYSRMALEAASLTAFFALLIFWLWFKMRETGYRLLYIALVGLTIGLATSTYQSFKLISLILAAALGIEILKNSPSKMAGAFLFVLATFAGSFPQIYTAYTQPEHFFSRASNTMIPFEFSVSYFTSILTNFFSNFSPHYLFLSFGESNNLSIGR